MLPKELEGEPFLFMEFASEKRCPCRDVEEIVKRSILASMGKRLPERKWPSNL